MVFVDLGKGGLNSSKISNFIIFFPAVCVKRSNRCLSGQQKNEVRMSMYFFFFFFILSLEFSTAKINVLRGSFPAVRPMCTYLCFASTLMLVITRQSKVIAVICICRIYVCNYCLLIVIW